MRIIVLTTHTPHHIYFVNRINAEFPVHSVYLQEKKFPFKAMFWKHIKRSKGIWGKIRAIILTPYLQMKCLDKRMIKYEMENCFRDYPSNYPDSAIVRRVYDVNDSEVEEEITKLSPYVIIDFGTGIIRPPMMNIPKLGMFNVHRGILPEYRGWDSDLWAIYFGRYDLLGPTIHYLSEGLDTGDIVAQGKYTIDKTDKLYEIRFRSTVIAAELVLQILRKLQRGEPLSRRPQKIEDGIMLSFMPVLLRLFTTVKFYLYSRRIAAKKRKQQLKQFRRKEQPVISIIEE